MVTRIEAITKEQIASVKNSPVWSRRPTVDLPLTDEQYEIFKKGYQPDWECRYAPVFVDGWFYLVRSGVWLFKFKYEKRKDGLWHIIRNYDTPFIVGYKIMLLVLREGYFEQSLYELRETYLSNMRDTEHLHIGVECKPDYCGCAKVQK